MAPSISRSSTLFVSNLPYNATSTDLQTAFSDLAPVRSAFVVLEQGSGVSKGVGYVSFSIKEDAQTAFESITMNGMILNSRNIRVQWAESKVISYRSSRSFAITHGFPSRNTRTNRKQIMQKKKRRLLHEVY
jgi:RNA recognition motif-containing protein